MKEGSTNKQTEQPWGPPCLPKTPIAMATIPYIEGVSDRIKQTLMKRGIQTVFRTVQTLGCLLMKVKPTLTNLDTKGVSFQVPCRDYSKVYIGETARKLNTRLLIHKRYCRLLQLQNKQLLKIITQTSTKALCWLMNNNTGQENQGSTAHQLVL